MLNNPNQEMLAARTPGRAFTRSSSATVERCLVPSELLEHRVDDDRAPASTLRLEQHEPLRIRDRERPQHHRVEDSERRRRGADPQPERQHRNDRETGITAEHPGAVPQVLEESVEEAEATLVAIGLFHSFDGAESPAGGSASISWRQAALDEVRGEEIEMCLNLGIQIGIAARHAERGLDSCDQDAKRAHDSSPSSRLTIATVRAQLSASAVSCFRPARVME